MVVAPPSETFSRLPSLITPSPPSLLNSATLHSTLQVCHLSLSIPSSLLFYSAGKVDRRLLPAPPQSSMKKLAGQSDIMLASSHPLGGPVPSFALRCTKESSDVDRRSALLLVRGAADQKTDVFVLTPHHHLFSSSKKSCTSHLARFVLMTPSLILVDIHCPPCGLSRGYKESLDCRCVEA